MNMIKTQNRLKVVDSFREIGINIDAGGSIDCIKLYNGSNENILNRPIYTRVDGFYDVNGKAAAIDVDENENSTTICVSGELKNEKGEGAGVSFAHQYIFKDEYIKVQTQLEFKDDVEVREVEIGSAYLAPGLNFHVCRPPAEDDSSWMNFSSSKTVKIEKTGEILSEHKSIPYNCFFYKRYVEGIEFQPDSNIYKWDNNFSEGGNEGLYFVEKTDDGIFMRRSPLAVAERRTIRKGTYSFGYYIGLPKIYEKVSRKWHFVGLTGRPWPTDEKIRMWAEHGINLLKIHNDFSEDGVFWHDGCFPPYDEENMREIRRIIGTAHSLGMKVITYFSLYELHEEAPGFENAREWSRKPFERKDSSWWRYVKEGVIYNTVGSGCYGGQMCLLSGWRDKIKENIKKAYEDLHLDGIYFDYVTSSHCCDKKHLPGKHITIDGIIDMLEWTRRLIGKDGVLALHIQTSNPGIIFENFADTVITLEEIAFPGTGNDDKIGYRMPRIDQLPVFSTEGEVIQRSVCPAIVGRMNDKLIASKYLIGMCASFGLLQYMDDYYGLEYVKDLTKLNILDCRFKNVMSGIIDTKIEDVKGAVYYNDDRAVVFIINLSGDYIYDVDFKINIEKINWNLFDRFSMEDNTNNREIIVYGSYLKHYNYLERIEPYGYATFTIKKEG